jgi:DNA-binding NtrC family response regulator
MGAERNGVILVVEDELPQRTTLCGFLRKLGYSVLEAASAEEAREIASAQSLDLLLTDLRLGGPDGVRLLEILRATHPDLQALVLTAFGTADDAVRAMKAGAYDFLAKPVDLGRLEILIEKCLERVRIQTENRQLRARARDPFSEVVGGSPEMQRVKEMAAKVAPARVPLLILGESGTGKEVLARAIHRSSPRSGKAFVSVNCSVFSETLVESELFGHEKGAFTGAGAEKKGRFELADGGTLFLDEVGDIPLPIQVKLLQVLQNQTFERVGGTRTIAVDVRLIAATHRDLEQRIRDGLFRADLFYRLNVVSLRLPPLRERREDLELLVDHFLKKHADLDASPVRRVAPEVLERLSSWPFPGNIRELENWIERAVVLADGTELSRSDFPPQLFEDPVQPRGASPFAPLPAAGGLEEEVAVLERRLIGDALAQASGNKSAAARVLRISERMIRYKMKKLGL